MQENVLIATFSLWSKKQRTAINGMIEPLLSFFLPKSQRVDLIDGPHPGSSHVESYIEIYKQGKLENTHVLITSFLFSPFLKLQNENGTQILFKIRDIAAVLEWGMRCKIRYDIFIGLESIYTTAGIVLKRLGLVKKVIYYVSDYSPKRYPNTHINNFYLALDRFCCYYADFIWDVSPAMHPARIKSGLKEKKSAPVILVPNALFSEQISYLSLDKIQPLTLVFAGTFGPENGVTLAIKAMAIIIKQFPKAQLHIIGGGHTPEKELQELTKEIGVSDNIIFHGFISDLKKLSKIIQQFSIGLAPYIGYPDSARWYADATKIRLYFGAGLPVITTHIPPLGKDVERKKAGIIVKDNEKDLADAVIKVFSDKKLYEELRKNAISFARNNTWKNSYSHAFEEMTKKSSN